MKRSDNFNDLSASHQHLIMAYQELPYREGVAGKGMLALLLDPSFTDTLQIPSILEELFQVACTQDDPELLKTTQDLARTYQGAIHEYLASLQQECLMPEKAFLYPLALHQQSPWERYRYECALITSEGAPLKPLPFSFQDPQALPPPFKAIKKKSSTPIKLLHDQWNHLCNQAQDSLLPHLGYALYLESHACSSHLLSQPQYQEHFKNYTKTLAFHLLSMQPSVEKDPLVSRERLQEVLLPLAGDSQEQSLPLLLGSLFGSMSQDSSAQLTHLRVLQTPLLEYVKKGQNAKWQYNAKTQEVVEKNLAQLLQLTHDALPLEQERQALLLPLVGALLSKALFLQFFGSSSTKDFLPLSVHSTNTHLLNALRPFFFATEVNGREQPPFLTKEEMHQVLLSPAVKESFLENLPKALLTIQSDQSAPACTTLSAMLFIDQVMKNHPQKPLAPQKSLAERLAELPEMCTSSHAFACAFAPKKATLAESYGFESISHALFDQIEKHLGLSSSQREAHLYLQGAHDTLKALNTLITFCFEQEPAVHMLRNSDPKSLSTLSARLLDLEVRHIEKNRTMPPNTKSYLQSSMSALEQEFQSVHAKMDALLKPQQGRRPRL